MRKPLAPLATSLIMDQSSNQPEGRAPKRRWVPVVLLVILFPVAAVHFSCVAVLGPGSWGSGVEEKAPELLEAGSKPELRQYIAEFAEEQAARPEWEGDSSQLEGTVVFTDHLEDGEVWMIQTARDGGNWTQGQRVYLRSNGDKGFHELDITRNMIVDRPTLLREGSAVRLVYGRWNSWAIRPLQKISRYLRSYFNGSLLPEYSLYLYDIAGGTTRYLGPGGTLKASPDRGKAAFLRSGSLGTSLHSIHVWDLETGDTETVLSLTEADPGSGRSFDYRWSGDSRVLHISGGTGGFVARSANPVELNLIYLLEEKAVYTVE